MIGGTGRPLFGFLVALAATALGCGGTTTQNYCPTIDATGGSVVGAWTTNATTPFCAAPYDRVSSGDWCSQLTLDNNGIRTLMLGHPMLEFKTGTITFTDANGTMTAATSGNYTSMLHFEAADTAFFPRVCIDAFGATPPPTCDDLTSDLGNFLASDPGSANASFRVTPVNLLPSYPPGTGPQAVYTTMDCVADPVKDGCSCPYVVGLDAPDVGQWSVEGTTLTLYSASSALPYVNDFAASGTELAMSGHGGLDLLGQIGLRMLTLAKKN
jgi:hypothetical protein